jgi:hypothetical protein
MATLFSYITKLLKKNHWTGAGNGGHGNMLLTRFDPAFFLFPSPTEEISPETEIEK